MAGFAVKTVLLHSTLLLGASGVSVAADPRESCATLERPVAVGPGAPQHEHVLIQTGSRGSLAVSQVHISRTDMGDGECCSRCGGGKPFCSPVSGNCYDSKRKSYYLSCTTTTTTPCAGRHCLIGWTPTSELSGSGQWCEVGRPPQDWSPLRTCPDGTRTIPVKVLTYNLFWWNLFDRRGGEGGRAGRLIASTSAPEGYDFMGFQECKDVQRVLGDAMTHGLPDKYAALSYVNGDIALGMIYNKACWALISDGTAHVGIDSPKQFYGRRGVHWARFQSTDGATLFFMNHHGPLPVSESGGCTGSATAYNIMRVIAEHAQTTDGIILVGDFNAESWSSRIQALDKFMHGI
mmetsp:Transcript_128199/g.356747  ORF Transcript_128199/g.356747 Transcript_128199/m.356747 type:complete len:349 (-) Transcript_128199:25-1071(-)